MILSVNGVSIERGRMLANEIVKFSPGDEVTLKILSQGKEREVTMRLEEFKEPEEPKEEKKKE